MTIALRRLCLLVLSCLLLANCNHHAKTRVDPATAPMKPIQQTRSFGNSNQLKIVGRMNVTLHTGYSKTQVILKGDPRDLAQIITRLQGDMLSIIAAPGYPKFGQVSLELHTNRLHSFLYQGAGSIHGTIPSGLEVLKLTNPGKSVFTGNIDLRLLDVTGPGDVEISGVHSSHLELIVTKNPKIQLAGVVNVSSINIKGDAWLGIHWLKTDYLMLRAGGKSFIQLAGIVNKLDAELWDKARFNGRYLRVHNLFMKTHGRSVAEVSATKKQHTLAMDASDIYFYELPTMRADFMAENGSVLDMRDWNYYFAKHYTKLNKYYASDS